VGLPGPRLLTRAAAAAIAWALALQPALPEGPVSVRFVEPAAPGLVLGVTRITVEAATSSDARIVSIAISVDGTPLSILTRPPYTLTWDAGAGFLHRSLRAVATDSAGRSAETRIEVRPLNIGQYEEVRLVNLYATVRDRDGRPVLDLTGDDFLLSEDGVPQTVSHFTSARVPLTVALLIDASNSMGIGGKVELARKAALEFADSVDPADHLMVLHFSDELRGLRAPVTDKRRVKEEVDGIRPGGGTALYDAVFQTAQLLEGREGRRAIVLLSDGRDQALTDNEPGSLRLFEEALEKVHRAEAAIYAVGLGRHLEEEMDLQRVRSLKEILDTLARQTGGRSYFPERAGQLSGIYRQIAADLRQKYALAYTSTNQSRDGHWRTIGLRVKGPGLEVQTRTGYYAPGPAAP
jgi:VWFA-related protein